MVAVAHFVRIVGCLLLVVSMTACANGPNPKTGFKNSLAGLENWGSPRSPDSGNVGAIDTSRTQSSAFTGAVQRGTGSFVSSRAPAIAPAPTSSGEDGYDLNLVDVPVKDAAKSVLGDTLSVNYVIAPEVNGTMTVQTSAPVSRDALIGIFETALAVNGIAMVRKGGTYEILSRADALAATPAVSVPSVSPRGPGVKVQVVELKFIAAEEMNNILQPISREGSILRVDSKRNLMILAGTSSDLQALREAIAVFDVDWMRGMSVALHPLQTSQPVAIADELDEIFGNTGDNAKVVRFVPNERLNALLVITSKPQYLTRAASWIDKLDRQARSNEEQLFVYQIQNRPAQELAEILRSVLAQQDATILSGDSLLNPS